MSVNVQVNYIFDLCIGFSCLQQFKLKYVTWKMKIPLRWKITTVTSTWKDFTNELKCVFEFKEAAKGLSEAIINTRWCSMYHRFSEHWSDGGMACMMKCHSCWCESSSSGSCDHSTLSCPATSTPFVSYCPRGMNPFPLALRTKITSWNSCLDIFPLIEKDTLWWHHYSRAVRCYDWWRETGARQRMCSFMLWFYHFILNLSFVH